jgi:hypothetical protein
MRYRYWPFKSNALPLPLLRKTNALPLLVCALLRYLHITRSSSCESQTTVYEPLFKMGKIGQGLGQRNGIGFGYGRINEMVDKSGLLQ